MGDNKCNDLKLSSTISKNQNGIALERERATNGASNGAKGRERASNGAKEWERASNGAEAREYASNGAELRTRTGTGSARN